MARPTPDRLFDRARLSPVWTWQGIARFMPDVPGGLPAQPRPKAAIAITGPTGGILPKFCRF